MRPVPSCFLVASVVQAIAALSIAAADPAVRVELSRAEEPGVIAVPGTPESHTQPSDGLRPEVLETFLRMRIDAAVLDTQAVEGPVPAHAQGLVPVFWLRRHLPAHHRERLEVRDAWGNPLLYWSDGAFYFILSLGAGGRPQFDYSVDPPYSHVPRGWAGGDPTDDLMIVSGVAYRGPISLSESIRRAMSDMRSAGTACEAFSVDYNVYPGPVQPIDTLERAAHDLEPVYIRVLPRLDAWGNPFLYWSDTQSYAIVSYGADGRPDYPYGSWGRAEFEALHTGQTNLPGQDIVFVTGSFVQWPNVGVGP